MSDREAFLRRFHGAQPGITSAALAHGRPSSYERLAAAVPREARVLDLGCGDGELVARLGERAVGVDLAPSGRRMVAGRAQELPFADGAFDACVCHLAFMLFDDVEQVVAELRRVAGGGLFAAVLGGGPVVDPAGDDRRDAFHRFLAIASLAPGQSGGLTDRRASSESGWRELFGRAPRFERFEVDLSGTFDQVWRFLGASYQLAARDAPSVRDRLRASYADEGPIVPCRVVMWLATVEL